MIRATSFVSYLGLLVLFITVKLSSAEIPDFKKETIGYDCGKEASNFTTMSLIDIDECDLETDNVNVTSEDIVLLQLNQYHQTEVLQCKIEVSRIVYYCGMWSHNSIINYATYIREITGEACRHAHQDLRITINDKVIENLKVNGTVSANIVMAGSVTNDGACEMGSFSDNFGFWPKAVVMGDIKVTLKSAFVKADVDNDKIYLNSGVRCKLSTEQCIDTDGGNTYWKSVPATGCSDYTYLALYEGNSTKFVSDKETVYSVNVDQTSFSLKVTGDEISCGVKLFRTESSKLFLMRREDMRYLERSRVIKMKGKDKDVNNLDIFQYVNAKFLYVERHIRTEIKTLYYDVMKHHCKLEKEMLKNSLAIASTQPDEFAFRYMERPGYMAVVGGEVIHILQCLPVPVKIRHADKCYNRLPIFKGNESVFLTPKTHIVTNYASEVPCKSPLIEHYKIQGEWYKFVPQPVVADTPTNLKPSTKLTWEYHDIGDLMNDGIYSAKDLDAIGKRIMFPMELNAVAADIAKKFTGGSSGPISFSNILDKGTQEQLAEDVLSRLWGKFIGFGKICAGLFGIFVFFSLLKMVADAVLNGFALYKAFGWSFKLVGACWSTLTNILISKKNNEHKRMRANLSTSTLTLDEKVDVEKGDPETARKTPIPAPRCL